MFGVICWLFIDVYLLVMDFKVVVVYCNCLFDVVVFFVYWVDNEFFVVGFDLLGILWWYGVLFIIVYVLGLARENIDVVVFWVVEYDRVVVVNVFEGR